MPPLEMTPEQTQELLDGLEVLVYIAGIGLAVLIAVLMALLLSMFRR